MEPPDYEKLFSALGRVTYAWSLIDTFLDHSNYVLYHNFGGKDLEPVLPHSALDRKIRFFRLCVAKSPLLADDMRVAGLDIGAKLADMADRRHWIIHGLCSDYQGETVTLLRSRLKLKQNEARKWTLGELNEFHQHSVAFGFGLALFFCFNLRQMPADQHGDFFRALAEECGCTVEFGKQVSDRRD